MKVLFLTEGALTPSTRFRVLACLPRLKEAGVEALLAHSDPPKTAGRPYGAWDFTGGRWAHDLWIRSRSLRDRRAAVRRAAEADVVFLQRDLTRFLATAELEEALARINPRLVFDLDDAIHLHPEGLPDAARESKIRRIADLARRVTAGNADLRRWVGDDRRSVLLPTPVDTDRYAPASAPRAAGGPFRLGWIGTSSNLPYLLSIAEPLSRVTRRRDAVVRVVCDNPPPPGRLPFRAETVAWSEDREVELLRSFDAGLMPLPDTPWTRGKCGLKLLLYLAAGIPAAASPVGVNREILAGGEAGLLPEGDAAWEAALDRLVADADWRAATARAGRARAVAEYSVARWAPVLAGVLREAAL